MDFRRRPRKINWFKWSFCLLAAAVALVIAWKFFFPPAPESLANGGGAAAGKGFAGQPASFALKLARPLAQEWRGGGLTFKIENSGHTNEVTDLLFAEGGRILLSSSLDGSIRAWDVSIANRPRPLSVIHGLSSGSHETASSLEETRGWFGRIHGIALSPDSTYLASAASSRIRLYNLRRGGLVHIFALHKGEITDLAFSGDGRFLASASSDGSLIAIDVGHYRSLDERNVLAMRSGREHFRKLPAAGGAVRHLEFSAGSLLVVRQDGSLRLYDSEREFRETIVMSDAGRVITCAALSRDGKFLLAGSMDRYLLRISAASRSAAEFARLDDIPRAIAFSPDSRQALVAGQDDAGFGSLRCFSFPDGRAIADFPDKTGPLTAMASALDDGSLRWASADQSTHEITLWNENGEPTATLGAGANLVRTIMLSPTGSLGLGIAGSGDEAGRFVTPSQRFDPKKLRLQPLSTLEPMEGRILATGSLNLVQAGESRFDLPFCERLAIVHVMDEGEIVGRIISGPLNGFHHRLMTFVGKNMVVCGGADGHLLAYNLKGEALGRLSGPEGDIIALAGCSTAPYVAAASSDHTVRFWDLRSLEKSAALNTAPSGDMHNIALQASYTLRQIGFPQSIATAMEKELGAILLADAENWSAMGQYLRQLDRRGLPAYPPVLSLAFFEKNNWLAWTDRSHVGFSSPSLMKSVGYVVHVGEVHGFREDVRFLPFESVYDTMFRPDLILLRVNDPNRYQEYERANRGTTIEALAETLLRNPPPEVSIVSPESGSPVPGMEAGIHMKITDAGGGIGDIRVYNNGKLVSSKGIFRSVRAGAGGEEPVAPEERRVVRGDGSIAAGKETEKIVTVPLVPGKNVISCAAMNYRNSIQSRMAFTEVLARPRPVKPRLFFLGIGINNFRNPRFNLVYTHADALAIAERLRANGSRHYSEVLIQTLLDATKEKLTAALDELARRIEPTDTFVFFASTHGALQDDRFCLVTSDAAGGELDRFNCLTGDELMECTVKIPAQKQVIILDTCHSGSTGWAFNDLYETRLQVFSFTSGLHLLAASSPYEAAMEGYNQHGLFSYFLVKGLEGEADYEGDRDGRVSVLEVARFAREQVKAISDSFQMPSASGFGQDVILIDRHRDAH